MVIDKVEPFYTDEEQGKIILLTAEIRLGLSKELALMLHIPFDQASAFIYSLPQDGDYLTSLLKTTVGNSNTELISKNEKLAEIRAAAYKRYYKSLGEAPADKALDDIKEILAAVTKEDFQAFIARTKAQAHGIAELAPSTATMLRSHAKENYKEFILYLDNRTIDSQIHAIYDAGELKNKGATIDELLTSKANEYYKAPKSYRTKSRAGNVAKIPGNLALPTTKGFEYSLSTYRGGNAYIQPIDNVSNLRFDNGIIYFDGELRPLTEAQIEDLRTHAPMKQIDLPLLNVFYSIILRRFEDSKILENKCSIFLPELVSEMGIKPNTSDSQTLTIVDKVKTFHNMVGKVKANNGKYSYYPLLNFEGYDADTNTVSFSSPYFTQIISTTYQVSIQLDRAGKPKLKSNGEPMRKASHSHMIRTSIASERNKLAVQNVFIITSLIERAGDNVPHISAKKLLEENTELYEKYQATGATHKARLLESTFTKTWKLLKTKTNLLDSYEDLQLPDENDKRYIPTPSNLNELVFEFPHKGKHR